MNESTGYSYKCRCGAIWKYETDYCPECGGEEFHEFEFITDNQGIQSDGKQRRH